MVYSLWGVRGEGKIIFWLNTVILTKVNLQSINYVDIPVRESNQLRGDTIWLGAVYFCNYTHDEILETKFSREKLHHDEFILGVWVESSDDESECNERLFSMWYHCFFFNS